MNAGFGSDEPPTSPYPSPAKGGRDASKPPPLPKVAKTLHLPSRFGPAPEPPEVTRREAKSEPSLALERSAPWSEPGVQWLEPEAASVPVFEDDAPPEPPPRMATPPPAPRYATPPPPPDFTTLQAREPTPPTREPTPPAREPTPPTREPTPRTRDLTPLGVRAPPIPAIPVFAPVAKVAPIERRPTSGAHPRWKLRIFLLVLLVAGEVAAVHRYGRPSLARTDVERVATWSRAQVSLPRVLATPAPAPATPTSRAAPPPLAATTAR